MDVERCIKEKVKKYYFIFFTFICGSINNIQLNKFEFNKIKKISISGLEKKENENFKKFK